MLPEHAVVLDPNDVVCIFGVVLFQVQKDLKLYSCLMLELLFVPDDLDGNNFASFVIHTLESLPKGSLTQEVNNLESISNLVFEHYVVVTSLVIVAAVVLMLLASFDLLCPDTKEVACLVVQDLTLLILSEARSLEIMLEHFGATKWKVRLIGLLLLLLLLHCLLLTFEDSLAISLH